MKHSLPEIKRWQRWLLLLIAFLSLGKGSAYATPWVFTDRCSIASQPTAAQPYIVLTMTFYDRSSLDNAFFLHDKGDGVHNGPAVYVDGNYICSPDKQLAWPGVGLGDGPAVHSACAEDGFWGEAYTQTIGGVTYTVRFYNPRCTNPAVGKKTYAVDMRVYLSRWEVGKKHTVQIKGTWRHMNGGAIVSKAIDTILDNYNKKAIWTTNAFECPWSSGPTAKMVEWNKVSLSGRLNNSYNIRVGVKSVTSVTNVPTAYEQSSAWDHTYNNVSSYQDFKGTFTPTNLYNDSYMAVQYSIDASPDSQPTKIFQWHKVKVPGFVKPKAVTTTPNMWKKSVKVEWTKDDSGDRSKEGTWSVYRGDVEIANGLSYATSSYEDKASDLNDEGSLPAYDKDYTYKVVFVPKNSSARPAELSASAAGKIDRTWVIENFTGTLCDDATHVRLSWNHKAISDASSSHSYELQLKRKDIDAAGSSWETIKTIPINSAKTTSGSYIDKTGLSANHSYQYEMSINLLGKDFKATVEGITMGGSELLDFAATRGTYPNMVKLSWTVKQVGDDNTNFIIYRRPLTSNDDKDWMQIHTTSGTGSNYSYDDNTVLNGSYNQYKVAITGLAGNTNKTYSYLTTDGFTISTGVVSGRVSYDTGTAVEGVKVVLRPQNGDGDLSESGLKSIDLSGYGTGFVHGSDSAALHNLFSEDFSIQMYINPHLEEMNDASKTHYLMHVPNTISLGLQKNDSTHYKPYLFMKKGNSSMQAYYPDFLIPGDEWSQITLIHKKTGENTLCRVVADTLQTIDLFTQAVSHDASGPDSIYFFQPKTYTNSIVNFMGYADEFRFFTKALTKKEILRNYNHPLVGSEEKLAIYYPFEEGLTSQTIAYDFSKTNGIANGRHAAISPEGSPSTSVNKIPTDLDLLAYTDENGNYTVRGVPYSGDGTSYSAIPELGIHEFSPSMQSRFVSDASLIHSGVDFQDVSSFPVSGKILFAGTNYPVEGANFYVDGIVCAKDGQMIESDMEGNYTISVPIGMHFIEVRKQGHVFVNNGRYPADPQNTGYKQNFNQEITGLEFQDSTLVNFTGRVVGGDLEGGKPLGFRQSQNNIGIGELVLSPTNTNYGLNVAKTVNGTVVSYDPNVSTIPVPSASDDIESTAWRGAGDLDYKKIIIHTDSLTGEFSAMVPPLNYKIDAVKTVRKSQIIGEALTIDLTNPLITGKDSIEFEKGKYKYYEYNKAYNCIYHASPTFVVKQDDRKDGKFGIEEYYYKDAAGSFTVSDIVDNNGEYKYGGALFIQEDPYVFLLDAYEAYYNYDANINDPDSCIVPLDGAVVTINNALSASQEIYTEENLDGAAPGSVHELKSNQLELDSLGHAVYKWKAGLPNISSPYWRTLTMSLNVADADYPWNGGVALRGIILGSLPTGNNFVTAGPDLLDMILRDPPGTGSSAEWSSGTVFSESHSKGDVWNSETQIMFTSHCGMQVTSGLGIGVVAITNVESNVDIKTGTKVTCEGENASTWSRSVTATRTISTSDDPGFVGADGDVFIGSSTNIIFGLARNVGFRRVGTTDEVEINLQDAVTTGLDFDTEFAYTQSYIENTLIPNLEKIRNSMLEYTPNPKGQSNTGDRPRYFTSLLPDDPKYGSSNHDKDVWGNKATEVGENGESYYWVKPQNSNENFQDSVEWCNNQISIWRKHLAFNEKQKVQAYEFRENTDSVPSYVNNSFDGGASVTYSVETEESHGATHECTVTDIVTLGLATGGLVNKTGLVFEIETNTGGGRHFQDEESTSETASFSYTLKEEGSDAITVDVMQYGDFGPIFRTRGGQTCNPYEGKVETKYYEPGTTIMEATMQIEKPAISVDVNELFSVPSGEAANFTLRLSNNSDIGEDVTYKLFLLDETNPNGAQLSIDGAVLTDGRLIKVPGNQTLTKALQVKQTNTGVLDYDSLGVVFASASEPDVIADTVYISAHYVPSSTRVDLAVSSNIISNASGSDLTFTLSGFDRNYYGLKSFRLQYKKPGEIDWTTLREFVQDYKNASTPNYEYMPDTGPIQYSPYTYIFNDGTYVFRVLSVSSYGGQEVCRSSNEVTVVKDMLSPRPLGKPEPTDGILDIGDELSITFNEPILQGELTKEMNFTVSGVVNGASVAHETALAMQNNEITAQTEAAISLDGKSFSVDTWVKVNGAGTLLSHGAGSNKLNIGVNNDNKLVVAFGEDTYTSGAAVPVNQWSFLTLNYEHGETNGQLSASIATDAEVTTLFNKDPVALYNGNGPLVVGKRMTGAIHELLLWDEAHDITTALANRSETKNPSTRHLIGYWKMNEGAGTFIRDYSRNRHMAMSGETWHVENENIALNIDAEQGVGIIEVGELGILPDDDYAVEFWMRADTQMRGDTLTEAQLIQCGEMALWLNKEGKLQLTGWNAEFEAWGQDYMIALPMSTTSGCLTDNVWHHIALNVQRKGMVALYVDGARVLATDAENVGGIAGSWEISIGARTAMQLDMDRLFKGQIDEVRIWNATKDADELFDNRMMRLTGTEPGLVAYYPFETKTLDSFNQVVTVPTTEDLTGTGKYFTLYEPEGEALGYEVQPTFTNEAPALRQRPMETNVDFTYTSSENKIVLDVTAKPSLIEGCILNFTVKRVSDYCGNLSVPTTWSAFIHQRELLWDEDELSVETHVGETASISTSFVNRSGKQQFWSISGMPSWMTANVEYGTLNPLESATITFTVTNTTPIGKYYETIYLVGNNDIAVPLNIVVRVTGDLPDWSVDPNSYEESMNLIANLSILNVPSEDDEDIVAAFINGECRGMASPKYNKRYDSYFVTMDIYGNGDDANEPVTFKVYDASTGITYPVVTTSEPVEFDLNALVGLYKSPIQLDATDEVEQNIALGAGWNWVSFNVAPDDMSVGAILASTNGKAERIKSQDNSFSMYKNNAWYGTLTTLNNREMYVVKANEATQLSLIGHRVKTNEHPITIQKVTINPNTGETTPSWNWIAYNGAQLMEITDAFAGMNPQDGDLVKAQRGMAYYDEYEWVGSLTALTPGQGYKVQSVAAQPRTFYYPSATISAGNHAPRRKASAVQPTTFIPVDYRLYPANMVLCAQVVNNEMPVEGVELGVFDGNDCREAAVTNEEGMVYMTIPGDLSTELTFRMVWNGNIVTTDDMVLYTTDDILGTPRAPFMIRLDNATRIGRITSDGEETIYDLSGRKLTNTQLKKGVYIVNGQKKAIK